MVKAVIFDIDGVLVDSRRANIELYKHILGRAGYRIPSDEEILACFHLPLKQSIVKLAGVDEDKAEQLFAFAKAERPDMSQFFTFPEKLREVLESLHTKYKLAVVTGRIRIGIEEVFGKAEIGHLFDVAIAFEDYENPKPHPEPLLIALERLGVSADEAMYIGDSDTDIEAARAANMRSIHLSRTPHPDATAVISEFHELLEAIHSLTA